VGTRQRMTPAQAWVLALASAASFMISLDSQVVATALSTIRRDLGASIEALEWTVNAYNLSFATLLLTGAALGDRLGRRRMFSAGLAVFTAASAACALAPSPGALIAARALQGVGAALVMPLALTLLSAAFPAQQRGRALGLFMGMTGLATFSGPFIGGAVAQGLAWEWIFWINLPIGLLALLLVPGRVPESFGPGNRLDLGGVTLATTGAFALVWGLVRGNAAGWGSLEVIASLAAGVVVTAAFVGWERRTDAPMLPLRLFRVRAFSSANAANFCLFASLYGGVFFMAQYLQTALGYGPLGAGLRLLPSTGTLMVCAPIAGVLADRFGERRLMVGGLLLQTAGMGWLALIADANLPYSHMLLPLIIGGSGVSMAIPAAQKSAVGVVAAGDIGKASGVNMTLRIFGGVFGVAIAVVVFAAAGSLTTPQAFTDGFAPAVGITAALALVGAAVGLGMPGRRAAAPAVAMPRPDAPRHVLAPRADPAADHSRSPHG
jgi:EmrB/QacA subfamily drug resistance transporter